MVASSEIPRGDGPPDETKSDAPSPQATPNRSKAMVYAASLAFVILVTVLVAVLPEWGDNKKEENLSGASSSDSADDIITETESLVFRSTSGPFVAELPLFSSDLTSGYSSREKLAEDLQELAKTFLNQAIKSNLGAAPGKGQDNLEDLPFTQPINAPSAPEVDEAGDFAADDGGVGTADDVESATDFSTNNQEENVDRADFVKSDGTYVYAAYQDYLLVWAVNGEGDVVKIQMPPLENPNYPPDIFEPLPEEIVGIGQEEISSSARSDFFWNSKPNIDAILLEGSYLTLVVSGYGYENVQALEDAPILSGYQATQIRVYENLGSGNIQLKSSTDINGFFRNAYSINTNAHIVTHSSLNTWNYLANPIQRWLPDFEGMDDEEYTKKAMEIADGLIEPFVDQLVTELDVNGEVDLARLAVFADSLSSDNLEENLFDGGIANSITQVSSFDMTSFGGTNADELSLSMAATFQPGHWGHVYATEGMIIVADQGWSWIQEEGQSGQKTYLIGFRLDGASSSHSLVGSVDGYMINSFALDFVERGDESYVRIATTQDFWTPWFGPVLFEEGLDDVELAEPAEPPESSTLNQIIVLRIPDTQNENGDRVLEQVGSVELGEENERFTTVRFFNNFAYAVTFRQTDPFYVVDLSGTKPVALGELKIPGFSQYLHSIDSTDQHLVAVGQNANDEGRVLGVQLSLFDASDPANPVLVDRLDVEKDENAWSGSAASWDERAFRFLKLGEKTGKVIIPLSISTWSEWDPITGTNIDPPEGSNFEGFVVFDIANDEITREFDIDHDTIGYRGGQCGWYGWLPERSMVFSGNAMTMKGYTVKSTSLSTGENKWSIDINDLSLGC